eukprot:scaffold50250_cov44-Phaeocystis_antarctica.AAC.1
MTRRSLRDLQQSAQRVAKPTWISSRNVVYGVQSVAKEAWSGPGLGLGVGLRLRLRLRRGRGRGWGRTEESSTPTTRTI